MKTSYLYIPVFITMSLASQITYAQQPTPADTYKQFGSFAALAEACYQSKQIPALVNTKLTQYASTGATQKQMAESLIKEFNEAYSYAAINRKAWLVPQQAYSRVLRCDVEADVNIIKQSEQQLLQGLSK